MGLDLIHQSDNQSHYRITAAPGVTQELVVTLNGEQQDQGNWRFQVTVDGTFKWDAIIVRRLDDTYTWRVASPQLNKDAITSPKFPPCGSFEAAMEGALRHIATVTRTRVRDN